MADDHNGCELVNVSSGTGSLGCPGQNPESRKMVVCVLMVLMVITSPHQSHLGRATLPPLMQKMDFPVA